MGASDNMLIQMVMFGFFACIAGVIVCIAIVIIKKGKVHVPTAKKAAQRDSMYYIHLTNRQTNAVYESMFEHQIVIGRNPQVAGLTLRDDRSVSKKHFMISVENGQFLIEDLNSSNHTWLNGRRVVGKVPIETGDKVTAGYYSYLVKLEEDVEG